MHHKDSTQIEVEAGEAVVDMTILVMGIVASIMEMVASIIGRSILRLKNPVLHVTCYVLRVTT